MSSEINTKRLINAEGVSDHTALLPTKNRAAVDFDKLNLTDNEKKILEMVYQNLDEATSTPYSYEKTTVTLSCGGELFTVTGKRNLELGWKKNRPDETKELLLPEFKTGDRVAIESVSIEEEQTQPPERFTDGTLLQAMEAAGKSAVADDDVRPNEWEIKRYVVDGENIVQETVGTYEQLPIKLAYATTIHKSQGATFEKVNLEPRSWDSGQLYVALSRVKDISGLYLSSWIYESFLKADPVVLDFYDKLFGDNAQEVAVADEIKEQPEAEVQTETAEIVEESKKVMGRPRKYKGSTHTTRVPDEIMDEVKAAIQAWMADPDSMTIKAVSKNQ